MSSDSIRNFFELPNEIWEAVFARLPAYDRRSVRLSCRRFYDVCNCLRIHNEEQIAFYGNWSYTSAALRSLASVDRKVWHLKLHEVHLPASFQAEFFRRHGPQIHSLAIDYCRLGSGLLKRMLEYCVNLVEFRLVIARFATISERSVYNRLLDDLRELRDSGTTRPSVRDLTWTVLPNGSQLEGSILPTVRDFLCFFDLFPNVNKFSFTFDVSPDFDDSSSSGENPLQLTRKIKFSCIHGQLVRMRQQLEKLHLHFRVKFDTEPTLLNSVRALHKIADIKMDNLKELSLNWTDLWDDSFQNPFSKLTHLTHFDCTIKDRPTMSNSGFVRLLVTTVTGLRTLVVRTVSGFYLDRRCFHSLVRSRLVTLKFQLKFRDEDDNPALNIADSISVRESIDDSWTVTLMEPNKTLRHLHLSTINIKLWLLFATWFPNLDQLLVKEFQEPVLANIFQVQTKLRTLVFYGCDRTFPPHPLQHLSLKGWLKESESPYRHQLDKITHLHISHNNHMPISEFLLKKIEWPNLESLKIELTFLYENYNLEIFSRVWPALKKLSNLKFLDLRCVFEVSVKEWEALLGALPKLQQIVLGPEHRLPFTDEHFRHFFHIHPALRSICVIEQEGQNQNMLPYKGVVYYFRNILTNSVEVRQTDETKYPSGIFHKTPFYCY